MSIFGNLQVLFKVTGKPNGKEDSYILMEGQRQDDIEVTKIDEKNGIVTFNNHGVVQTLPLVAAAPSSGSTPSPVGGNPAVPGFNPNNGNGNNPGGFGRFGQRGGRVRGGQNAPNMDNSNGNDSSNLRAVPTRNGSNLGPSQNLPQLSPEEQVVGIELNRELTKQQVLEGSMPPLPPTAMTPDDATGGGGGPLIVPPAPGN